MHWWAPVCMDDARTMLPRLNRVLELALKNNSKPQQQ
jgi:hypothetical protein